MLKQKATILLIGLMCFSSVSGFFKVTCHGSDGHIAEEPLFHNHCQCPEPEPGDNLNHSSESHADLSIEHSHCKDTITAWDFYVLAQKNRLTSLLKIVAGNSFFKSISFDISLYLRDSDTKHVQLSPFFTPLRTVILLA
jgi:hypothetical protein